jgi:HEAT repeat protein/predicted small lipoprotein YifL
MLQGRRNMKLLLSLTASALLAVLLGCGGKKPETVPPKTEPPKTTESGSSTGSQETGTKEPEKTPKTSESKEPTSENAKGPKKPPQKVSEDLSTLAARLVEKSPQGAWRVNEAAALELEKLGDGALGDLVVLFEDARPDVRRGAAYYLLANFNPDDKNQVAGYLTLLSDSEPFLRSLGLQAVRKMTKADQDVAVPRLAKMLAAKQEPSDENRAALARLLGSFKQDAAGALKALTSGAKEDASPKVRGAYLVAISQIASPADALPAFRQGLSDQDVSVRLVAAARLRQLGKDAAPAAEDLAQGLEDSDPRVREVVAEALAMLGSAAVEPVCKHLDSKAAHTRQLAIACLGKLGPAAKSALPLVEKHLTDSDPEVKQVAEAVARILKGP